MPSKSTNNPGRQFMVKPHRPWRWRLFLLVLVGLLAAAGWQLFERGRLQAGYDTQAWQRLESDLQRQIRSLEERNSELLNQNALLERSAQIERNAHDEVKGALADVQAEMIPLSEELSFYRGLVTPTQNREGGLTIQSFSMSNGQTSRMVTFKLVLTQVKKNDRFATGKVDLQITGQQAGKPRAYSLTELSKSVDDKFKFKYFQNVVGVLELPEGFEPQSVKLEINPKGTRLKPLAAEYSWQSIFTRGS